MSFSLDLSRFTNLSEKKMTQVVKKTFIELSADIIKDTPVDTGRARGNWQPAINKFADTSSLETDKTEGKISGAKTIAKVVEKANEFKLGDTVTLTNNLSYVKHLEYGTTRYGFSPKAPAGFVGINILRFSKIVGIHAKDINRKTR